MFKFWELIEELEVSMDIKDPWVLQISLICKLQLITVDTRNNDAEGCETFLLAEQKGNE